MPFDPITKSEASAMRDAHVAFTKTRACRATTWHADRWESGFSIPWPAAVLAQLRYDPGAHDGRAFDPEHGDHLNIEQACAAFVTSGLLGYPSGSAYLEAPAHEVTERLENIMHPNDRATNED